MARAAVATLAVAAAAVAVTWAAAGPASARRPQQDDACLACVCRANGRSGECVTGDKCTHADTFGPFCISLPYWIDAGKPVLPGDDRHLPGAFQRCVEEPFCAVQTVRGYMETGPALQDCDKDGAVTCRDLMLTHINGRYNCVDRQDARVDFLMRCLNATTPTTPPSTSPAPTPPRPARPGPPRLPRPAMSHRPGGGGGGGGDGGDGGYGDGGGDSLHAVDWSAQSLPGSSPYTPRAALNALNGGGGGGGGFPNTKDHEDPRNYAPRDTFNALHGAAFSPNNYEDYEEDWAPAPHSADDPRHFRLSPEPRHAPH